MTGNYPAAGKAGMAPLMAIEYDWSGLPIRAVNQYPPANSLPQFFPPKFAPIRSQPIRLPVPPVKVRRW